MGEKGKNLVIKVILDTFKTKIDKFFSLKFIYLISEKLKIFLLQNNFVKLRGRKDFQRGVGGNGLTKIYRILTGLETLAAPLDSAGDSLTKLSVNTLCFYKKLLRKTLTIDTKKNGITGWCERISMAYIIFKCILTS